MLWEWKSNVLWYAIWSLFALHSVQHQNKGHSASTKHIRLHHLRSSKYHKAFRWFLYCPMNRFSSDLIILRRRTWTWCSCLSQTLESVTVADVPDDFPLDYFAPYLSEVSVWKNKVMRKRLRLPVFSVLLVLEWFYLQLEFWADTPFALNTRPSSPPSIRTWRLQSVRQLLGTLPQALLLKSAKRKMLSPLLPRQDPLVLHLLRLQPLDQPEAHLVGTRLLSRMERADLANQPSRNLQWTALRPKRLSQKSTKARPRKPPSRTAMKRRPQLPVPESLSMFHRGRTLHPKPRLIMTESLKNMTTGRLM